MRARWPACGKAPTWWTEEPSGGASGLEGELALGVGRDERTEIRALGSRRGIVIVDLRDVDHGNAAALVAARGGDDRIAAPEGELADDVWRDEGVARLGEVAVAGAADIAAIAAGVEPA